MDNSELIDKYIKGEMSSIEQQLFEEKMTEDSDLQKSVAIRRALVLAIQGSAEEDLKQKLKELDEAIDKKNNSYLYFKLAASVVVVIALAFYFFTIVPNKEMSIADYDLVDIGLPNKMGKSDQLILMEGMNYFKQQDYANALTAFKGSSSQKLLSDTAAYYAGICYFRLDSIPKAIEMLQKVASIRNSKYQLKAEYRLGLCYWKNGNLDKAKYCFINVSNAELADYSTSARRILKRYF